MCAVFGRAREKAAEKTPACATFAFLKRGSSGGKEGESERHEYALTARVRIIKPGRCGN